nr:hypothetical protein [Tanacetum cinerariifolium]
ANLLWRGLGPSRGLRPLARRAAGRRGAVSGLGVCARGSRGSPVDAVLPGALPWWPSQAVLVIPSWLGGRTVGCVREGALESARPIGYANLLWRGLG